MNKQGKLLALIVGLSALVGGHAMAESEPENRLRGFVGLYASACVQHLTKPNFLREKLTHNARLTQAQSRDILLGLAGDAWVVPGDSGFFLLGLASETPLCVLTRSGEDLESTRQAFERFASSAPAPLIARRRQNQPIASMPEAKVLTYTWGLPDTPWVYVLKLVMESSDRTRGQPFVAGIAAIASKGSLTELEAAIPMPRIGANGQAGGT